MSKVFGQRIKRAKTDARRLSRLRQIDQEIHPGGLSADPYPGFRCRDAYELRGIAPSHRYELLFGLRSALAEYQQARQVAPHAVG